MTGACAAIVMLLGLAAQRTQVVVFGFAASSGDGGVQVHSPLLHLEESILFQQCSVCCLFIKKKHTHKLGKQFAQLNVPGAACTVLSYTRRRQNKAVMCKCSMYRASE